MKIIGITGGVGAGKSTVLNFLKEMCDCEIVMADDVAKDLMKKGGVLTETAYSLFGDNVYLDNGNINAALVAGIIFSDAAISFNPSSRLLKVSKALFNHSLAFL